MTITLAFDGNPPAPVRIGWGCEIEISTSVTRPAGSYFQVFQTVLDASSVQWTVAYGTKLAVSSTQFPVLGFDDVGDTVTQINLPFVPVQGSTASLKGFLLDASGGLLDGPGTLACVYDSIGGLGNVLYRIGQQGNALAQILSAVRHTLTAPGQGG